MDTLNFPCKGCGDRQVGCHAQCEKYQSIREQQDKLNIERQKNRDMFDAMNRLEKNRRKSLKQKRW